LTMADAKKRRPWLTSDCFAMQVVLHAREPFA